MWKLIRFKEAVPWFIVLGYCVAGFLIYWIVSRKSINRVMERLKKEKRDIEGSDGPRPPSSNNNNNRVVIWIDCSREDELVGELHPCRRTSP
ncbi:hypothetical protein AMTR_s00036p00239500 [Amborella trichopoda]|uniref:Uncharacterized protein n=1 Tax=Amborella trichopoda TaxID=13333 RepID=U5CQM2_AMBTC|nr:hypothetical protein AMTR_s00036p00239500 [Amborella trichopoda]